MMPPCGTFDYVNTVPKKPEDSSSGWAVRLQYPVKQTGPDLSDRRLVGYTPRLRITGGGLTSGPSAAAPLGHAQPSYAHRLRPGRCDCLRNIIPC